MYSLIVHLVFTQLYRSPFVPNIHLDYEMLRTQANFLTYTSAQQRDKETSASTVSWFSALNYIFPCCLSHAILRSIQCIQRISFVYLCISSTPTQPSIPACNTPPSSVLTPLPLVNTDSLKYFLPMNRNDPALEEETEITSGDTPSSIS